MTDLYKPLAISLPFTLWIFYKVYRDTGEISWYGLLFILVGIGNTYYWIQNYKKEKYLRSVIDWIEL